MAKISEPKVNRAVLMQKVQEIIRANSADPAAELRRLGQALLEIGEALDGIPASDARAVLMAVEALN